MSDRMNPKTLRMLLFLIMLIIAVCAFRFGYIAFGDKEAAEKTVNDALNVQYLELFDKIQKAEEYKSETAAAKQEIAAVFDSYSVKNTPEKILMILIGMEEKADITISSITFGSEAENFSMVNVTSDYPEGVTGYTSSVAISFSGSYKGFENALSYIREYPEHMSLASANASFDSESGLLSGTMQLNLYSLEGTGKEYVAPVIGNIPIGKDNIFGTIE